MCPKDTRQHEVVAAIRSPLCSRASAAARLLKHLPRDARFARIALRRFVRRCSRCRCAPTRRKSSSRSVPTAQAGPSDPSLPFRRHVRRRDELDPPHTGFLEEMIYLQRMFQSWPGSPRTGRCSTRCSCRSRRPRITLAWVDAVLCRAGRCRAGVRARRCVDADEKAVRAGTCTTRW